MRSGRLQNRLTLQRVTRVRTPSGGFTDTWTDVATVYGAVEPLRGVEYFRAGQQQIQIETRIVIRDGSPWADIDNSWRIQEAASGETWDIISVIRPQGNIRPGTTLEIMAKTGTEETET